MTKKSPEQMPEGSLSLEQRVVITSSYRIVLHIGS